MFLSFSDKACIRLDADFKQIDVCDRNELYLGPVAWDLHGYRTVYHHSVFSKCCNFLSGSLWMFFGGRVWFFVCLGFLELLYLRIKWL